MEGSQGCQNAKDYDRLRSSADELLKKGATPRVSGGALSVDALTLLYQHASAPETAADALKLLHELRTHQVELDLLYEQLQANEHEITEELIHYKSLYELAPAGYLIVANDGQIIEGNQAAGALFKESVINLAGEALCGFLAPGQEAVINSLLRNSGGGEPGSEVPKTSLIELPNGRCLTINVRHTAAEDGVLVILAEINTPVVES